MVHPEGPPPEFHRLKDLPAWTRVGLSTWKRIVQERLIPSYKVGRSVLVTHVDVRLYLLRGHRQYQPRPPKKKQPALAVVRPIRERQVSSEQVEP